MGTCGSKHHHSHQSAVVLESPDFRRSSHKKRHDFDKDENPTLKGCTILFESESDATTESVLRASSSPFKSPINAVLENNENDFKKTPTKDSLLMETMPTPIDKAKKASPLDHGVLTDAQKFQMERKERIRKRLEEVRAQVAEGHRRVEALKNRQSIATPLTNQDDPNNNDPVKELREALLPAPQRIPPTPLSTPQPSFRKLSKRDISSVDVPTKSVEPKEASTVLEWNYYAREPSAHNRLAVEDTADDDHGQMPSYIRQADQDEDVISLGASELNLKYESILDMRNLSVDIKDPADNDDEEDEDSKNDLLSPLSLQKKSSWVRDISEVVDQQLKEKQETATQPSSRRQLAHPQEEEPPSFSSTTCESHDTRSTVESQEDRFCNVKDSLHQRKSVQIPTEPIIFQEITDKKLRRSALKLFKRLNPHDPWDINHRYNDDEVFEFIEEHPEVTAVRYDFENFSGRIFPLSVLCTLGASVETIQLVYKSFPRAIEECDVWIGTPLHYAMQHKAKFAVVSFLISQHPFMLQERNQFGRLPLHMASLFRASSKTVSLLLEEYSEAADEVEKDGYTPLHLACENGSSAEVVKLLMDGKPERCMAMIPSSGSTPLHLACTKNANKAVISELMTVGADAIDCLDAQGYGPLHLAIKHQVSWDVIQCLVNVKPESVDMKTSQGYSVLFLAKKANASPGVLRLLTADD